MAKPGAQPAVGLGQLSETDDPLPVLMPMKQMSEHNPGWRQLFGQTIKILFKSFPMVLGGAVCAIAAALAIVLLCVFITPVWSAYLGTLIGLFQLLYIVPLASFLWLDRQFAVVIGLFAGGVLVLFCNVMFLMLLIGAGVSSRAETSALVRLVS